MAKTASAAPKGLVCMYPVHVTLCALALALFSGCDGDGSTDCRRDALDPTAQEACWFDEATQTMGDRGQLEALLTRIPAAASRDLLRLRLVATDPIEYGWLCDSAETDAVEQKCDDVLGRPHLRHRRRP